MASGGLITDFISYGSGAPSGAPDVVTGEYAFYQDADDGTIYVWNLSGTPAWAALGGGAVDADDVTYTPTTLADWDSSTDPGDVEQALDQLAERTTDLEAGGGATVYPSQVIVPVLFYASSNGAVSKGVDATQLGNQRLILPNDNTAYVEYPVLLQAGTWRLDAISDKANTRAILTFSIDGVSVGTQDAYAASPSANFEASVTGIVVAATGVKTLRVSNPTKNASSSGYAGVLSQLVMRKTA